ncbi:Hpt domain-containing protein [Sphingorhabdus sp. EL138]|jgi:HPt (histidine-containing phosphotransfer) domain-containing protein|uniref:Hpt domain-containing protein n=1 Tax=Sphingorhabdus sp. EL138 TaxID=2073156 RepID=UPI000D698880|nr:Hpt domain-containing protein [Sphingorhabdus sp. EL138]
MSFDYGALDAALTAAVGDDQSLIAELRTAFLDSAKRQVDLLHRARCDANWEYAALRLKGLAASFGATHVLDLAEEAVMSAPGEPTVLKKLERAIAAIEDHRD